jgi:hypothetical protein
MASKVACHIELCKNLVQGRAQDKAIVVKHVDGKINPADIFINKMRNETHFHCL